MERLIIYGSQYGTTKRYAQRFSEMTGIPSLSYEAANDLTDCKAAARRYEAHSCHGRPG